MARKQKSLKLNLSGIPTEKIMIETVQEHPITGEKCTLSGHVEVPVTSASGLTLESLTAAIESKDPVQALVRQILRSVRVDLTNKARKSIATAWLSQLDPIKLLQSIQSGEITATPEQRRQVKEFVDALFASADDDDTEETDD